MQQKTILSKMLREHMHKKIEEARKSGLLDEIQRIMELKE